MIKARILKTFHGTYQDKHGTDAVELQIGNDGHSLQILVRDAEFTGFSIDLLMINSNPLSKEFPLKHKNCLHSFELDCEAPFMLVGQNHEANGSLKIQCKVPATEEEWEDAAFLKLSLTSNNKNVQIDWCKAGFEDELHNLQKKLPEGVFLKCCFNCEFSSYNPYVNSGVMGQLCCFVDSEDKFATHGKGYHGWETHKPVFVQELHLCSQFLLSP
ncbi:MAG: hypothetical protein CL608_19925 [Anaerolineaceae bacterium]|nr:hypothetical protein [Anaerolineaceae bacterium]